MILVITMRFLKKAQLTQFSQFYQFFNILIFEKLDLSECNETYPLNKIE